MRDLDVERARALTPGCEQVLHLNHAGSSLLPQPVLDAVIGHLRLEAAMGGYEAAAHADDLLEHTYDAVATLLGAHRDEIALVDSATTAWNAAVNALPVGEGDRVLLARAEYGSNALTLLQLRARTGCELVLVDDDAAGQVDLDALEAELAKGRVAFVSIVHIPTGSGLVNPVEEVGSLCRAAGVPLVLDACQSAGQLPLDVDAIGCDVLAATGRKFLRGPRGTGFLYVRASLLPRLRPASVDIHGAEWTSPDSFRLRDDARRFEQFEADVAARIGLGVAIDHALGWGLDAIADRVLALAAGFRERLAAIDGVTVRDKGARRGAICTFDVAGVPATAVVDALRAQRINVNATLAAYARHDLPHRGLGDLVRASVHYINTDDELDRAAEAIAAVSSGAAPAA